MTTTTSVSGSAHPVALAYAVAALQRCGTSLERAAEVAEGLYQKNETPSPPRNNDCVVLSPRETRVGSPTSSSMDESLEKTKESSTTMARGSDGPEEDAEQRLARSRERNREHARRTRLRKKAQLEALQSRVKGLEAERLVLKQNIEDCGIASILVGLACGGEQDEATQSLLDSTDESHDSSITQALLAAGGKRKRFISDAMAEKHAQPLKVSIDGRTTIIGAGKCHVNWKTGVYSDESGHRQLSPEQLESLRRERNRMHAKMTRDRKKCFIATIEKTIANLEHENQRMRGILAKVSSLSSSSVPAATAAVTPVMSPELGATEEPQDYEEEDGEDEAEERPTKRRPAPHGFSLDH